jgi:hypothetical protein
VNGKDATFTFVMREPAESDSGRYAV